MGGSHLKTLQMRDSPNPPCPRRWNLADVDVPRVLPENRGSGGVADDGELESEEKRWEEFRDLEEILGVFGFGVVLCCVCD